MTEHSELQKITKFKAWMLAARPKTLPAAAIPVIVGTALALGDRSFNFGPALAALLAALLIQVGTNFANDVFDFKKGTDTQERTGPLRVTNAGLLTPNQVLAGMWVVFGVSFLIGLYLVVIGGWPILLIGILSIFSGIVYTGGPYPLGYNGLGDIFVFIFFGPVAVCATYYLQAGTVSTISYWASLPAGFLVTAILVVNNLRDIETDRKGGKKTLAVRLGAKSTQVEYIVLLAFSYAVPVVIWLAGLTTAMILITWFSLPLAVLLFKDIFSNKGSSLNETLAETARLGFLYGILFSLGYVIDKLIL